MQRLPAPPVHFSVPPVCKHLAAGHRLWRIHFRSGPHPTAWDQFRSWGPTGSRFDHHTLPKRAQGRMILYGTSGPDAIVTALAEVFQDTRLIDRARRDPWLVAFDLAQPLKLLDTASEWPVRAGGNMAINSGLRSRARHWSRAIYREYQDVQGIWYPSSITNHECVALYERGAAALSASPAINEPLNSLKLLKGLSELADDLNYGMR